MTSDERPIGHPVRDWTPPPRPGTEPMVGDACTVEPLDIDRHAEGLFEANRHDGAGVNWTYLPYGPFDRLEDYVEWMRTDCVGDDPMFHTIVDHELGPVGVASYLRVAPAAGSIEVGHINYSPLLQRHRAGTEAMYLMMRRAFDLGYRRYEWKCDALNAPSRRAAERLGFTFEGVFRQAAVVNGRNRDTAWYSILDSEWTAIRTEFERWLDADNFDAAGAQRTALRTAPA
ncbi:MAG: GNAT family N-acetyltransferase [Ilumatobacteraceae bacterium]